MQFKNPILLAAFIPLISANPAANPGLPVGPLVTGLPLTGLPATPLGVPATVTNIINSVASAAGKTGLPIVGSLSVIPSVTVPTGLPISTPSGLPLSITALTEAIEAVIAIAQLILGLLTEFPTAPDPEVIVDVITALLDLLLGTVPAPVPTTPTNLPV